MKITWIDSGRSPVCQPNPLYPSGIDVVVGDALNKPMKCKVDLPYPAPRCGHYRIECAECGYTAAVTTAGRQDDPRSVTMPCLSGAQRR